MNLFEILERLTDLTGVSGDEGEAGIITASMLEEYCDTVSIDGRGNVIGRMEGTGPLFHFDAHLDRIGLIITSVEKDGFLKFDSCGGIDGRLLPGREVLILGKKPVTGIVSSVPPHLQGDDREKATEIKDLAIDTGLTGSEAEDLINLGDRVIFPSIPGRLLNGQVTMGALDDRSGIASLLLLAESLNNLNKRPNVIFTFSVQEEVGGRGAKTAVFNIEPDYSFAIDVTFAWTPGCKEEDTGKIGEGPLIGYSPLLSHELSGELCKTAEKYGIPFAREIMNGRTGTHGDELATCASGIKTGIVSIPLKYMHTPIEVIEESDVKNTASLLKAFVSDKLGLETAITVYEKEETKSFLKINQGDNSEIFEIAAINGISGRETPVREYIEKKIPKNLKYESDSLGNLYVHKKGNKKSNKTLMIEAHMDEVGLIITSVTDEGYLNFATVGGIDPTVLLARHVYLESGINGIIGYKPIHLIEQEEREKIPKVDTLKIDIGAKSKEEALKYASPGDYAVFIPEWTEFGNERIKMKALDDRLGCAIMLNLLKKDLPYDTEFVFTVQEEVGTRGAGVAAFNVNPDIALILETTTAGDIHGVEGAKRACLLGSGPVISYMDRGTIYDKALYNRAVKAAEENNIPWQTKTLIAGGNDSSAVQRAGSGTRVLAISVPTRYLHSPSCVINKEDVENTEKLTLNLLKILGGPEV